MAIGGLAGLTLILLVNVSSGFAPYMDAFATLNILLFICLIFSPYLLIYGVFDSNSRWSLANVLVLGSYILFAPIIGAMIAYLARGDNYFSGFIRIPNEFSWVVVAIIAILLLIPLINFFSLLPIAIWLGSLIYGKAYQTSYFFRTLIGSPLFAPLFLILIACEISRTIRSRQSMVYAFNKTDGTITQHRPPKAKLPLKRLLATMTVFCLLSSLVAAGLGVWNEQEEAKIVRVSNLQLSTYAYYENYLTDYYLIVSFSLVNVRDRTVAADGYAELSIFNKNGSLIYNCRFGFSQRHFKYDDAFKKWVCIRYISGESFLSSVISGAKVTVFLHLAESVNFGNALLKVYLNNGGKTLNSTTFPRYLLSNELLMRFYFRNDVTILQTELDKQWPIKARISNYFKLGNYGWMVVGRTSGEIVFYPWEKIYNWYILQSTDGGCNWDIAWKGDSYPTFNIQILSEKEVQIITPYGTFATKDEGKTWEKL